jgi:Fe2+ or Zn2+ uptake regulation protein
MKTKDPERQPRVPAGPPPGRSRGGESLHDYEQRLRDGGQFATVQRRAILRYLLRHGDHPTTAQIAASVGRSGAASLATVYNNLALFAKLQLLRTVRAPDGELRWDLRTEPHHHLACSGCGRLVDIEAAAAEVVVHDPELRRSVQRAEVWLIGRCAQCA